MKPYSFSLCKAFVLASSVFIIPACNVLDSAPTEQDAIKSFNDCLDGAPYGEKVVSLKKLNGVKENGNKYKMEVEVNIDCADRPKFPCSASRKRQRHTWIYFENSEKGWIGKCEGLMP